MNLNLIQQNLTLFFNTYTIVIFFPLLLLNKTSYEIVNNQQAIIFVHSKKFNRNINYNGFCL